MLRILIITLILGAVTVAVPFVLPQMLMPNLVSGTHADTETNCLACHEPGQGTSPDRCLACHEDIGDQRGSGVGVHSGLDPCMACHSEHHGRDHDTRGLDSRTFDHTRTGFWLAPLHDGVACDECHGDTAEYQGLAPDCLGCHPDWRYGGYDHATERTGFTLSRFHRNLDCTKCHDRGRGLAAGPYQSCVDCHGVWTTDNFNHNVTSFALTGTRQALQCIACHESSDYTGLDHDCPDCPW
ncbi:MAG: cytochrome c3 family protein [Chloroflexi bacterium]|nr:cytochrome c3 family protein [Chloroflexota bacterium]MBU1747270.1 cytochrome c3 family protein [Chloroflexota bacterium]MBU1877924.1 cytochrome c3 family protein [Chloroflexota bacterium]